MRIVILGAGFGGLELATVLSEALGDGADVTLIDQGDAFVFGYSKLDVMFGRDDARRRSGCRTPTSSSRACASLRETITAIDPEARRVTTDAGVHEADVLVVALGADYDFDATPGLVEGENEFYSRAGAERLRDVLPTFTRGRAIVGVCGAPFKCPPAPSEAALLLHDYLSARGVRDDCEISLVMPFGTPVPPSPDTSAALVAAFAERGHRVRSRPPGRARSTRSRSVAVLDDGAELPVRPLPRCAQAPRAGRRARERDGRGRLHARSSSQTLETRFPGVYAVGDVATVGVPKAGVFAEGAARVVAAVDRRGDQGRRATGPRTTGRGSCYVEFGAGRVGRVDVDFLSGPKPTGTFQEPSRELVAEKEHFGASRRARWFDR